MTSELMAPMLVLALLDSTSFGTLLIPLWLMLAPGRLRPTRVLLFLGTVGLYYLALGIALLAGARQLADVMVGFLSSPAGLIAQLLLGVGLIAASFLIGPKKSEKVTASASASASGTGARAGRLGRWRARVMGGDDENSGPAALAPLLGLALVAALVETASMVPYLSAIGMMTTADAPFGQSVTVLVGYCLVMIAPAAVLLVLRVTAASRVEPALRRLEAWLQRTGAETTAWIVGIVGFLIAQDAIRNGVFDLL